MKILITNMQSFRNKGFEAIVKVIIQQVREYFSNAEFIIFSDEPKYDSIYALDNSYVRFLPTPIMEINPIKRAYYFVKKIASNLIAFNKISGDAFREADIVIATSGEIFSCGYRYSKMNLQQLWPAIKLKKKIVLLAHSIGPFKTEKEERMFSRIARKISLITLREHLSFNYLKEINMPKVKLELTADPAFLFSLTDGRIKNKLSSFYKLPKEKIIIGVCVNQGLSSYSNCYLDSDTHLRLLINFIRYLNDRPDMHIMLIPHGADRYIKTDDGILCHKIHRSLDFSNSITVISLNHSAEELKALISCCEVLISERMHAAIAGLSQYIPTLFIGYSMHKNAIFTDIYENDKLMADFLIPVNNLNENILIENFKRLFNGKEDIRIKLKEAIPIIKNRAERNFTLLASLLGYKNI